MISLRSVGSAVPQVPRFGRFSGSIALDQSAGEKSLSHCKKLVVANYFITLAKGSCNSDFFTFRRFRGSTGSAVRQVQRFPSFLGSTGSSVPRSAVPQISLTRTIATIVNYTSKSFIKLTPG